MGFGRHADPCSYPPRRLFQVTRAKAQESNKHTSPFSQSFGHLAQSLKTSTARKQTRTYLSALRGVSRLPPKTNGSNAPPHPPFAADTLLPYDVSSPVRSKRLGRDPHSLPSNPHFLQGLESIIVNTTAAIVLDSKTTTRAQRNQCPRCGTKSSSTPSASP